MFKEKRGQMKISFGMIFSIILIAIFIGVAIYGITQFLSLKDSAQIGQFKKDFQNKVDEIWNAGIGQQTFSGNLPGKIEKVCFASGEEGLKMEFYEEGKEFSQKSFDIEHAEISSEELCFPNGGGGGVGIRLEIEEEPLVQISKP